ncbi:MAG: DegT/DnrJ/EryC1/StrS family aminotransferase [Clostridia bacterium]|nr:DegT/DnrJ/EryC1/StrS family aminotransferase [Clostridia bacterium]
MIPLVKPYMPPKEELLPAIEQVLYSGYIAEGEAAWAFEDGVKELIGNPNTLAVQSGTAALHLALLLLNVGAGDEVISTPMTSEPTNTAIAITGAKVVWADVDPNTGLLDPASVRAKITGRTKAIMLVHYAGMVCDMDAFNQLSQETGVPVIEDAAHSLGAKFNGKVIGSNSRFTCFSFQAIKQLTTVDGGAIAFKNAEDVAPARKLRWFGLDKKVARLQNDITRAGYKYGINNLTGIIGVIQLRHIADVLGRYIENGRYYDEALKGVGGVTQVPYYPNTEPSYWLYTMKVENRDDFCRMMEAAGVTASPLHHRSDTHSVFAASRCDLPHMDEWYRSFVHIPCGWWVDAETRERIVDSIKKGW